jgi:RNA polymerase sigma-70 factor, ECF subfamily
MQIVATHEDAWIERVSMSEEEADQALFQRAAAGDQLAWRQLIDQYQAPLRRMLRLRLNRRLQGRVDEQDILQEAYVELHRRLIEYVADPKAPPYLWVRHIVGLKLAEVHRRHLGTQARDADREVTLHRGGWPEADSASLAAQLLGALTSPSQAVQKAELRLLVQTALAQLDPDDREILALKHFELLSTMEMAQVLGLSKAGAGHRYIKAIKRLRQLLEQYPDFAGW